MCLFAQAGFVGVLLSSVSMTSQAMAEIKVGAILFPTGPAASLGISVKNTIDIVPRKIADESLTYVLLDDASDPPAAVRAAKKLIEEEKVDIIPGTRVTSTSLAAVEGNKKWVFKSVPKEPSMAARVFGQMKEGGGKAVGFIGGPGATPVQVEVEKAIARIQLHAKTAWILVGNLQLAKRYMELGATFVAIDNDGTLFSIATTKLLADFRETKPVAPAGEERVH